MHVYCSILKKKLSQYEQLLLFSREFVNYQVFTVATVKHVTTIKCYSVV